ncbi:UDP-3-O-acyl-N-acetylglucosamine deacetylase [Photobacterium galatheae]|uniref:UDP-3-O-acyl-N-acetylglucosamine deacetylase n=1 Tax=Photobacterium galatheae TaxID=1654360 RepID=A0A066RKS5_9GAMM|nr:UDP-3-O-acyl-N-acetylglucosamine deacetylase [Photobacterium galatheae]KDM91050.1 hypothetical protein EA58_15015 [Photobacterium galatheae]MCM0148998.1 UDP-3-O-[3-hydroxymyristoyl] N-acetylglucosamine deacetylase [Photobacterium galatheae]
MVYGKTIQREVSFYGVGLHTSAKCALKITPAQKGEGLVFNLKGESVVVNSDSLKGSCLGSNIVGGQASLRTVEHLLSALSGLGITDAYISTNDIEVPILDGSAADFFNQLKSAGICLLGDYPQRRVANPFSVSDGSKMVEIVPRDDGEQVVDFSISFNNQVVQGMPQKMSYIHNESNFYEQIAFARTFGFKRDLEALLSNNLCLGGSLENAILIDDDRVINLDGLRFKSEIISHKILDILGDLYPLFRDFTSFTIKANQAGHAINNQFLKGFYREYDE